MKRASKHGDSRRASRADNSAGWSAGVAAARDPATSTPPTHQTRIERVARIIPRYGIAKTIRALRNTNK